MSKQIVKINYHGFWLGFSPEDNVLYNALKKNFEVVISDNPDFVFCSWFTEDEPCKFKNCVKIFYSYENHSLNMFASGYNYAIGLRQLSSVDNTGRQRYLRYCLCPDISTEHRENLPDSMAKRKFCNFIYSNQTKGDNAQNRIEFCLALQNYKHVDCPGKCLNNMDGLGARESRTWYDEKLEFLKDYKFTIAFENAISPGYVTEKILQPFIADSVPIYMGSPTVAEDFNPKAFINVADYKNFDEVIEKIKELDNNDELYMQMLREPVYTKAPEYDKRLEEFLYKIVSKGNTSAQRFVKPFYNI